MTITKKYPLLLGIFRVSLILFFSFSLYSCSNIEYNKVDVNKFNKLSYAITSVYSKGDTLIFESKEISKIKKYVIKSIVTEEYNANDGFTFLRTPGNHKRLIVVFKKSNLVDPLPRIEVRGFPKDLGQEEDYSIVVGIEDLEKKIIKYETLKSLDEFDTLSINPEDVNLDSQHFKSDHAVTEVVWSKKQGIISFNYKGNIYTLK